MIERIFGTRSATALRGLMGAACLCGASLAMAQPTGNPKGTIAPSTAGNATKQVPGTASPRPEVHEGGIDSSYGPTRARTHRTQVPGGKTAGGLTKPTREDSRRPNQDVNPGEGKSAN